MKKAFNLIMLIGLMALSFTSCKPESGSDEPELTTEQKIIGRWVDADKATDHWVYQNTFVVDSLRETENARWGYCWDEADDVTEQDVLAEKNYEHGYPGNGWFQWWVDSKNLTQVHMMTVSEAREPKYYTITLINSTTLKLKDSFGITKTYIKQ
ncbi:MAG: hypothetical protein IJS73_05475 [Paludibacteraceae bacterium]|nr:hypothetical protein [Paludibacteraceae bacterium]